MPTDSAEEPIIHEKHINQLFGTCVVYWLEAESGSHDKRPFMQALRDAEIVPVFYTSTTLSDTARSFAHTLGVRVFENRPLAEYPMVKCNKSYQNRDRIYHLPFDQQYDRTSIDLSRGEFWTFTVREAEEAGFRRAFRWKGGCE